MEAFRTIIHVESKTCSKESRAMISTKSKVLITLLMMMTHQSVHSHESESSLW